MAELNDLFRTDQYVGPERLTDLCYKLICENLDIISVKGKRGHRILRRGLTFPSEICDKIIEYAQQSGATKENDCFFSIFKNLTATRLKHVRIANCSLTDASIHTLVSHRLHGLELSDCNNLTEFSIEHINANSENLHSLAFHGKSTIIPSGLSTGKCLLLLVLFHSTYVIHKWIIKLNCSLFVTVISSINYHERGYVLKAPNLKRLALEDIKISALDYVLLLAGLTNLTHLDLSNNSHIDTFEFYHLVPNLVSLTLYNVRISDAKSFVKNICQLSNLRYILNNNTKNMSINNIILRI